MADKRGSVKTVTDKNAEDAAFAESVKRLRERKGWSQGELARRLQDVGWENFHQTTVSRIEKGERPVRLSEARALANALDSSVGDMVQSGELGELRRDLAKLIRDARKSDSRVRESARQFLEEQAAITELLRLAEAKSLTEGLADLVDAATKIEGWTLAEAVELAEDAYAKTVQQGEDLASLHRRLASVPRELTDAPLPEWRESEEGSHGVDPEA
ncbi:helix-turn-helix transcriptional regulator [Cellulosimicrobium composti]|uniref:helix-turn-helix transcriptional regulator n=1 Tax=Cellulosimicrobium composti TaxID=2672572 RepID=UPI0037AB52F6